MKTEYKVIALIFTVLICFGIGAFIGVKVQPEPNDQPVKDSLLIQLDTVKIKETVWRTKIKTIRETDTITYIGTDTACIEIIERKKKLIQGLDSLVYLLDSEAHIYSDLNVIEIRRNALLSDSINTITLNYKDSLKNQSKQYKKRVAWYKFTTTVAAAIGIYGIIK